MEENRAPLLTTPVQGNSAGRGDDETVKLIRELRRRLFRNTLKIMWRDQKFIFSILLFMGLGIILQIILLSLVLSPSDYSYLAGISLYLLHLASGFLLLYLAARAYQFTRLINSDRQIFLSTLDLGRVFSLNVRRFGLVLGIVTALFFLLWLPLSALTGHGLVHIILYTAIWSLVCLLFFGVVLYLETRERENEHENTKLETAGHLVFALFVSFFVVPAIPALILLLPGTLPLLFICAALLLSTLRFFFLWNRDVLPVCGSSGIWSGSFELKDSFYTRYIQPSLYLQESLPYREGRESFRKKEWWKKGIFDVSNYRMSEEGTGWGAVDGMFWVSLKRTLIPRMVFLLLFPLVLSSACIVFVSSETIFIVTVMVPIIYLCSGALIYFYTMSSHPFSSMLLDTRTPFVPVEWENFYLFPFSPQTVIKRLFRLHLRTLASVGVPAVVLLVAVRMVQVGTLFLDLDFLSYLLLSGTVCLLSLSTFPLYYSMVIKQVRVGTPSKTGAISFGLLFLILLAYFNLSLTVTVSGTKYLLCFFPYLFTTVLLLVLTIYFYRKSIQLYETISISR